MRTLWIFLALITSLLSFGAISETFWLLMAYQREYMPQPVDLSTVIMAALITAALLTLSIFFWWKGLRRKPAKVDETLLDG